MGMDRMKATAMLMVRITSRSGHCNDFILIINLGFEQIVVNYGTDIPNLEGDYVRYLYGPGSILVAHGDHEYVTVGDLEKAVEDYQKLILHTLGQ